MTDRERLLQILNVPIHPRLDVDPLEAVADYLLDNGVTFAKDTNVPSWIPVSERLPDDSRSVILCTRSRIVGAGFYNKNTKNWVQYYSGGGICIDVTHWMPLPEPPKEDTVKP